jgi:outer membrane protein assembly factor BamE (lipoprotein component of BamABCDE complex)
MKKLLAVAWILVLLGAPGCVQVDPKTGKPIPRGSQRYEFDTVQRRAERLEKGMTKSSVIMLLGSPAEVSDDKDVWVYLPERPAVLIPGRALRLVFENGKLVQHGYRAIVLGKDL